MNFNNNLSGTYRYIPFEKTMARLILDDLDNGITSLLPAKFANVACFILAYGHTPRGATMFPEYIIQKIEDMAKQFTIFNCLQLATGIRIAMQMR